jgi:heme exporter protein C
MGEVGRILYVHVPAAWLALVCFLLAFLGALGHLLTGSQKGDRLSESAAEVGVVMGGLLLVLGSLFARPTWGVWWTWDPRLTSSAVMWLSFVGVLLLRGAVHDPERRASWSNVATVLAFVNIPITYFSVQMWRSIHQVQSSPETVASPMVLVLRWNAFAFLFLALGFIVTRSRLAARRAAAEQPPAPEAA